MHGNTYKTNETSPPSPLRPDNKPRPFTPKIHPLSDTRLGGLGTERDTEWNVESRWQPVCYIRVMTPCHKAEDVYFWPQQGPLWSVSTTGRSARRINIHGEPTGREWSNFVPGQPSCLHNDGKYSSLRASMAGMPAGVPGASGHMITFVFIMATPTFNDPCAKAQLQLPSSPLSHAPQSKLDESNRQGPFVSINRDRDADIYQPCLLTRIESAVISLQFSSHRLTLMGHRRATRIPYGYFICVVSNLYYLLLIIIGNVITSLVILFL